MRRQPSPYHGRLWRALLAVLVLAGLGIWHGGHCPGDAPVRHASTTVAGPRADAAIVLVPAATVLAVAATGHRDNHAGAALEVPDTAADDCHLVSSTEPATTTRATCVTPPVQTSTGIVIGAAARRPVPRLLTGRSPTEIGVSRT